MTFSFLDTPYLPWCLCWCWQICCQLCWCFPCCQAWGRGSTWGSLWCLWICRIWSWSYDLLHMKWSSCWSWILKMEKLLCRMKMNYSLVHRVIQFQRHVHIHVVDICSNDTNIISNHFSSVCFLQDLYKVFCIFQIAFQTFQNSFKILQCFCWCIIARYYSSGWNSFWQDVRFFIKFVRFWRLLISSRFGVVVYILIEFAVASLSKNKMLQVELRLLISALYIVNVNVNKEELFFFKLN